MISCAEPSMSDTKQWLGSQADASAIDLAMVLLGPRPLAIAALFHASGVSALETLIHSLTHLNDSYKAVESLLKSESAPFILHCLQKLTLLSIREKMAPELSITHETLRQFLRTRQHCQRSALFEFYNFLLQQQGLLRLHNSLNPHILLEETLTKFARLT